MKICMITSYPPDKCGISDYSERLIASLRKTGTDVMIISREGDGIKGGKNIHRVIAVKKVKRSFSQIFTETSSIGRAFEDVKKSMKAIKEFGPDAVHIQYEPGLYNLFYVPRLLTTLRKARIKTIITLHAIDYFPLTIFHKIFLYGKPDKVVVHTKTQRELIKNVLGAKNPNKVKLVPMGLVPQDFGKDGKYILFFGFLNQHKGVEYLLEAFSKTDFKQKLVLIGSINPVFRPDVEYKDKIKFMISDLNLRKRVEFIYKFVPDKSLSRYVKNSMFVVFPYRSSYSGAQSQAIIDAIAFGKPLIVTKPAQGNLVDNENAIVINPDSVGELAVAMRKLANSKNLRKSLSFNNRKLANKLKWLNIAKATRKLYGPI